MYMSLHRYDNKTFFPRRDDSRAEFTGRGTGTGFNVNVAWETGKVANEGLVDARSEVTEEKKTDLGSNEYRYACDELLIPLAKKFSPDIILISCGFDGGIHD